MFTSYMHRDFHANVLVPALRLYTSTWFPESLKDPSQGTYELSLHFLEIILWLFVPFRRKIQMICKVPCMLTSFVCYKKNS